MWCERCTRSNYTIRHHCACKEYLTNDPQLNYQFFMAIMFFTKIATIWYMAHCSTSFLTKVIHTVKNNPVFWPTLYVNCFYVSHITPGRYHLRASALFVEQNQWHPAVKSLALPTVLCRETVLWSDLTLSNSRNVNCHMLQFNAELHNYVLGVLIQQFSVWWSTSPPRDICHYLQTSSRDRLKETELVFSLRH